MSYDRQKSSFQRQVYQGIDKGIRRRSGGILNFFDRIPTILTLSYAVSRHEFPILHNIVNPVFIVQLVVVVATRFAAVSVFLECDFGNFRNDTKPSTSEDFTERQFYKRLSFRQEGEGRESATTKR